MSIIDSFKDLEEPLKAGPGKEKEKFPCMKCGGTGVWKGGYMNPVSGPCHACKGKGYFLTSPEKRAKAKSSAASVKEIKRKMNLAGYAEKNKDLMDYLEEVKSWNSFARSLLENIEKYGDLTTGQNTALNNMYAKHLEKKKTRAKEGANCTVLDLARINELIGTAKENGLKRPKLRVGSLEIYLAPMNGKNAGCLYVKDGGEYAGKINKDGKFFKAYNADDVTEALEKIAEDPLGAMTEHGRETGTCSCCGRELTNKESIEAGIGPVCAENFGV